MTKAAQNKVHNTGDTVIVGLKSPNGIILQLQKKELVRYPKRDGSMAEIEEWHPDYEKPTYTLNGNRVPFGQEPKCLIVGGFAMTSGIPKDFWDEWRKQNANLDLVKNGMIFAHGTEDGARSQGTERRELRSGQEPLRMEKGNLDERLPKKRDPVTGAITKESAIEIGEKAEA
jgi:hypothetical protein